MCRGRGTSSDRRDSYFLCIVRVLMAINLLISWNNIVLLFHCVATATLIQLIWCFKPTKGWYLISAIIAFVAGVGCIYVGIELLPPIRELSEAGTTFTQHQPILPDDDNPEDDDYYDNIFGEVVDIKRFDTALEASAEPPCEYGTTTILRSITCEETLVGAIAAFGSGALWFLVIDCILRFVDTTWWEAAQEHHIWSSHNRPNGNHSNNNYSNNNNSNSNNNNNSIGNGSGNREDLIVHSAIGSTGRATPGIDRTDETARLDSSWRNDGENSENHGDPNTVITPITEEDDMMENAIAEDELEDSSLELPVNSIEIPSGDQNVRAIDSCSF